MKTQPIRLDELPELCRVIGTIGKRMAKVREIQQQDLNGGDVFEYKKLSKTERKKDYKQLKRTRFNKKSAEKFAIKHFMSTGEKITISPDITKKGKNQSYLILLKK